MAPFHKVMVINIRLSHGLHSRAVEDLDALSDALAQARGGLEDAGQALSPFNEGLSRHTGSVSSAAGTSHRVIRLLDELMQRPLLETASTTAPAVMLQGQTPVMNILMVEDLSRAARDMATSLEAF